MRIGTLDLSPMSSAVAAAHTEADRDQLVACCRSVHEQGGRLVALWGADERDRGRGFTMHVALAAREGLAWLSVPLAEGEPAPDLAPIFPAASRMQRALHDLLGVEISGGDARPWLRHDGWPADRFPLRRDFDPATAYPPGPGDYVFVQVEGDGVHEIPVGPIHAGIIEPGHFRFSVVGEKVLRLEERLGYVHKGIEKRFETLPLHEGYRLAGRVSGDSTVAYAWAYSMAAESASGCTVPERALWLRALMLERERIANHLGDLGAIANDAGLAFGLAQFMRLREDWLRLNAELFGHRLLMDRIVPGGVSVEPPGHASERLAAQCDAVERELQILKKIYDDHAGLQDRFLTTGRVEPPLAAALGVIGLAGRASGQAWDLRVDAPCAPYDKLEVNMATHRNGDVAARVTVRFEEVFESLRLIRLMLDRLAGGESRVSLPPAVDGGRGIGWVEGWRGDVLVAVEAGGASPHGVSIRRCHCHDPSWQNWPAVEHAIIGDIVPDFPLINKSFNLSYSGQDL